MVSHLLGGKSCTDAAGRETSDVPFHIITVTESSQQHPVDSIGTAAPAVSMATALCVCVALISCINQVLILCTFVVNAGKLHIFYILALL